jgi:hypothetical protein
LNINAIYINLYIYIYNFFYIYIIDASWTLRFLGFFENDAPDASLPKNAPASLRALVTLVDGDTWLVLTLSSIDLAHGTLFHDGLIPYFMELALGICKEGCYILGLELEWLVVDLLMHSY